MKNSDDGEGGSGATKDAEPVVQLSEAYVHSLASLGLERLQNEPGRLHSEATAVDEALHSLSLDHYRVFIQNQECVRHVRLQGQSMEKHLSALLAEVHGLGSEFSVFQREAAELVGGHKRNRQTLKHHMQLVELLEVPQLMDACVRSDLMEEALSIATFASTLERRHRSRRALPPLPSGDGDNGAMSPGKDEAEGHLPGVIKMIVDEVRESARGLNERLVAKLRGPIQLTSCLQVVSCLRRLELLALEEKSRKKQQQQQRRLALARQRDVDGNGAYNTATVGGDGDGAKASGGGGGGSSGVSQRQLALVEMKLQVDFLEARDAWLADAASRAGHGDLKHALGTAPSASPYQVLMDLIESSRSQWFEVATQFRAIFLSMDGGTAGRKAPPFKGHDSVTGCPTRPESGDVLSLWLLRRVSGFVDQLKALLPFVEDGGSLRSLLEECMFFGASMGRLGTDFRGLLVPVFEERVCGVAAGQWATASAEFLVTLRDIEAIDVAGGNGATLLYVPEKGSAVAAVGGSVHGRNSDPGAASTGGDGPPPPPRSLMAFPPVARLMNQLLTSFNQLRECTPASVKTRLAERLVQCFMDIFRGLAELKKSTVRANAAAAAAAAAAAGSVDSLSPSTFVGTGGGGRGQHNSTTARAVEQASLALSGQAVPHMALCFACLFGEVLGGGGGAAANPPSTASAGAGGGKGGRGERLRSRLLDAMEALGIYERPAPPRPVLPPPMPMSTATAATVGVARGEADGSTTSDAAAAAAAVAPESTVARDAVEFLPSKVPPVAVVGEGGRGKGAEAGAVVAEEDGTGTAAES